MKINPTGSHTLYSLIALTALSFSLQPTNVRIFGISISIILIFTTTIIFITQWKKHYPGLALLGIILLGIPIIFNKSILDIRIFLLFIYIIYVTGLANYQFKNSLDLYKIWSILGWVCLFLGTLGFYRYLFGFDHFQSENKIGISSPFIGYHYLGISYAPSTRNSDAIYFGIGFLILIWQQKINIGYHRLINTFCLFFLAIVAMLTLSRGLWVSLLASIALMYNKKNIKIHYFLCLIFSVVLIYLFIDQSVIKQMIASMISIFNPSYAYEKFGFISSNSDRIILIKNGLLFLKDNQFGINFDIPKSEYQRNLIHYENIYIDLFVIFGIFIIPMLIFICKKIKIATEINNEFSSFIISITLFLLLYHLFNSGINFIFLWFTLALCLASIKHMQTKRQV